MGFKYMNIKRASNGFVVDIDQYKGAKSGQHVFNKASERLEVLDLTIFAADLRQEETDARNDS
jgi:hypothetical protein